MPSLLSISCGLDLDYDNLLQPLNSPNQSKQDFELKYYDNNMVKLLVDLTIIPLDRHRVANQQHEKKS